jgi:hypothetical protein
MGILDKFKTPKSTELKNGSEYAPKYNANDGAVPETPLAGKNSPLHADKDGKEGFSLNGKDLNGITKLYSEYDDGAINTLPIPTELEDSNRYSIEFTQKYDSIRQYTNPEFTSEVGLPNPTPKP